VKTTRRVGAFGLLNASDFRGLIVTTASLKGMARNNHFVGTRVFSSSNQGRTTLPVMVGCLPLSDSCSSVFAS
jgi:hypothetical protein